MSISIQHIHKKFGQFQALNDVHFDIPDGELVALLGPSGCGKTTLLRMISGLDNPDSGEILFSGQDAINVSVQNRQVGFVFQHYALFKHMNVRENIGFSLMIQKRPKKEIAQRVDELLELIQLGGLADRYPSQLSGGQKQRVALARALAARPKVLLLDEPFGALDAKVRQDLRRWLRNLHDELKMTSVFVTHDQEEAFEVSDRVVIMNKGKVEQIGTPDDIFHNPVNEFVMNFLGNVNIFHSRVEQGKIYLGSSEISVSATNPSAIPSTKAYVRPHALSIHRESSDNNALQGKVTHMRHVGLAVKVTVLNTEGQEIQVELSQDEFKALALNKGETVFVTPKEIKVFSSDYSI